MDRHLILTVNRNTVPHCCLGCKTKRGIALCALIVRYDRFRIERLTVMEFDTLIENKCVIQSVIRYGPALCKQRLKLKIFIKPH